MYRDQHNDQDHEAMRRSFFKRMRLRIYSAVNFDYVSLKIFSNVAETWTSIRTR